MKAKVFALNPDEYEGVRVGLTGKVAEVFPTGSYFVVEDETGKVLVTTERLPWPLACPQGSTISITGSLNRVRYQTSHRDGMTSGTMGASARGTGQDSPEAQPAQTAPPATGAVDASPGAPQAEVATVQGLYFSMDSMRDCARNAELNTE